MEMLGVVGVVFGIIAWGLVGSLRKDFEALNKACLSDYHPHPLYVVCLLGLQARAGAGALRRRSG